MNLQLTVVHIEHYRLTSEEAMPRTRLFADEGKVRRVVVKTPGWPKIVEFPFTLSVVGAVVTLVESTVYPFYPGEQRVNA